MTDARVGYEEDPGASRRGEEPDEGYRAAVTAAAIVDRPPRTLLTVSGRAPGRMLQGVVTGTLPPEPEEGEGGLLRGRMHYSAILTPKGRLVSDLRLARLGNGEQGALLMDLPGEGTDSALEHLRKYLPPRFAQVESPDPRFELLSVVGPRAPELIAREVLGERMDPELLEALAEGEERVLSGEEGPGVRVVRNRDVRPPAFDVIAPSPTLEPIRTRLELAGARPAGAPVWETLRLEKGRPAYGYELDEATLPPEAGIVDRAVDHMKGCYTGQEVIVRIRDRGRVNRRLRGILLGEVPPPEAGTPLFHPSREASAGETRSTAESPRFGQAIALAYLRREVDPPARVRIGSPTGPEVEVRALDDEAGWILEEGDPGRN